MWVVKLGGSLLSSGSLKEWLSMITEFGAGKLLIVSGAGIFSDHIRDAQQEWKFNHKTAHKMALLAMEQYAHLLQSYAPSLILADSIEGIKKAISLNQVPVWLPFKMINTCEDVSENWNLTSDSLALWLAGRLNAKHVLLIKSLSLNKLNSRALSESEMIDKDFPVFLKKSKSGIWWLDKNDIDTLQYVLKTNDEPEKYLKAITY